MALNDYSFLSTIIGGGFPQTGGSAISGSYFELIISPINGHEGSPNVIAADDFSIGNAAENPSGSNIWFGGNVDSIVEKVEFVDQTTPYDIFNIVFARVYIIAGSIMPTSDLVVLVDVDYTAPSLDRGTSIGRPFCIKVYTPSSTTTCIADSGTNAAYTGISSTAFSTNFTQSAINPNGTSGNPFCLNGFNEHEFSGTVPEGQTTLILSQTFVAATNYHFPETGIGPDILAHTQNLNFTDNYTVQEVITRNADNQITTHKLEYYYTPPVPAIEDVTGNDIENIAKFCNLLHHIVYYNYTPLELTGESNGKKQFITNVNVNGQTGTGTATDASAGPTPISSDGEQRAIVVAGSDFAGYQLHVKKVVASSSAVQTLVFATTHPTGSQTPNAFTNSTTATPVVQLNLVDSASGRPTFNPSSQVYAIDYPKSNNNSFEGYVNPVSYHEYFVTFPATTATQYYDIYIVKTDAEQSGNSDSAKANVATSVAFSGAGTGAQASQPIRIYQYADPTLTIQPAVGTASNFAALPDAASKSGVVLAAGQQLGSDNTTGVIGTVGHFAISFVVTGASGKTITIARQPKPGDFVVASGGNGLIIYYEDLLAELNNTNAANAVTITGNAYIEQSPVDNTVITIATDNITNVSGE